MIPDEENLQNRTAIVEQTCLVKVANIHGTTRPQKIMSSVKNLQVSNQYGETKLGPQKWNPCPRKHLRNPIVEGPRKTVWIYNLPLYWIQTLSEKVLSPQNYATNTSYGSIGLMKSLFSRKLKSPIIRKSPRKQNQLAVQSSAEAETLIAEKARKTTSNTDRIGRELHKGCRHRHRPNM